MAEKNLVASIIEFLSQQLENGDITADSRESLEVAIQCLESAYGVQATDAPANMKLLDVFSSAYANLAAELPMEATPEEKAEAEALKNEGNAFMKSEKFEEALHNYTKAIKLDGRNAVYYGNRAAVFSKMGKHMEAVKDCQKALSVDPTYSKAYGRLGLAYSGLNRHKEARDAYLKAVEMEPDNESYRNNLNLAEEKLAQEGRDTSMPDLGSLFMNPSLMNMARQMMTDPEMQNVIRNLMGGNVPEQGGGNMSAFLEAGQRFAQSLQSNNPEVIESLRRQMGGQNNPDPSEKS